VDDYLSESEQWERAKAWVRSYGGWILGGVLVALGGIAGWNWYQDRQTRLGLEASAKYEQLTDALGKNDLTRAKSLSAELERDYPKSPYVDQAHLFDARIAVEAGDLGKAETLLRGVMDRSKDDQLALVARLRLARVQLAQNKPDDALATLNGKPAGAFEARFHEARGDVLFAKGDKAGALKEYLAAEAGADTRSVDVQSLQLKINDLKPEAPAAQAIPASPEPDTKASAPANSPPTPTQANGAQ
jgi:predicted negative regulator of RcsB-dependent stress response